MAAWCQDLREEVHAGVVSHFHECSDLKVHSTRIYLFEL